MAAYAALVSVMHIIDQLQHHPRPPISLDKQQIQSLTKTITFLQEFLEGYSHIGYSKEADPLESCIVDAAYAAEDVIESNIVDQIHHGERISTVDLYQGLQKVIQDMDSIKKEVMEIEQNTTEFKEDQLHINISSTPSSTAQNKLDVAAALVSLVQIIDQIKPNSLDEKQIESFVEKATFFQDFVHGGVSREEDGLVNRIANAAYSATDIIQSHLVDHQILFESISCFELLRGLCTKCTTVRDEINQGLQKVMEDMDLIKKEVMEMKEKTALHINVSTMVGFDDVLLEIIDNITGGGQLDLQIVPIVGMGGIGKTTLARNIYTHPLIKEHFDVCAWVTISQEYNTQEILHDILSQANGDSNDKIKIKFGFGESLSKFLAARRYLIVMDDMWSVDAWDKIKFSFPDYKNGSRIVVTTRLSNLGSQLTNSYVLNMKLLDEINSWNLFSKTVFGEESCPSELEEIGKNIVRNCGGLPLSIVVVGGLVLSKSKHTTTYWEYIEENLSSVVISDNDEHCLKILHMSYNELPVYLKPCFLYMGVFKEDYEIRVSKLIKLWVAEGFLKPFSGKSLEEIAKECLKELIKRNLLSIHELGSTGNIKYCKIHDLLRDLCLIEAQKEKFYNVVIGQHSTKIPQRRIVIPSHDEVFALQSQSHVRSLICDFGGVMPSMNSRLLRVLEDSDEKLGYRDTHLQENMSRLVNLRYVAVKGYRDFKFPPSICLLWNLHTLIFVDNYYSTITAPDEFWTMSQLRHVEFITLYLPYPTTTSNVDEIALNNLHTLRNIYDFTCGEEMVKRIPNIKKLKVCYKKLVEGSSPYHLNNLDRLHKLESFHCSCWLDTRPSGDLDFLQSITFPNSLKKLSIGGDHIHWEALLEKIGSLPLLQKLKLFYGSFRRSDWETVEGQFCSLKFLHVDGCYNLECWTTESSHFPRLERLVLKELRELKEIPSDIGNISTLKLIKVVNCHDSAIDSAKRIREEQEELGNEGLQVQLVPVIYR